MSQGDKERKEEGEGFKISDKRRFNTDGTGRESPSPNPEASRSQGAEKSPNLPEIKFADLVLSFAGSAQIHLGLTPHPLTEKAERDLKQAKQTIDLLGMLAEKTRGNLSPEEDQLLQVILTDLRFRYVEETKK